MEMNTPDTEWEKELRKNLIEFGSRCYWYGEETGDYDLSCMEEYEPETLDKIMNLLSSRDTYWKERVGKEVVVCSAVMASDGSIYRGHRHGHAMQAVRDEGKELMKDERQQGFITTNNRYVSREEGRKLQDRAGIPSADKDGYRGKTLFSEDLYQHDLDTLLDNLK